MRAMVRDLAKTPHGVDVVQGDFERPGTLEVALDGVERAFLLTPNVERQEVLEGNFIDAAKRAGLQQLVKMSAIGPGPDSPVELLRAHGRMEERLAASGLTHTVLRPHSFMQNMLGSAGSIAGEGVFYGCRGEGRIGLVDVRDIAAVAARALTDDGHEGKTYVITGPESLSCADLAARLSVTAGREVRYIDVPADGLRQGLLGAGLPPLLANGIVELDLWFAEGGGDIVTSTVQDVTGKPARSFDEFARDHASVFKGGVESTD